MNRTVVFAAVLSMAATVASAQPAVTLAATSPVFGLAMASDVAEAEATAVRIAVDFRSDRAAAEASRPSHVRLDLVADAGFAGQTWTIDDQRAITFWASEPKASNRQASDINWVGLVTEQLKIDGIMHLKRLTETKTRGEFEHSSYFGGYAEAVNAYFTDSLRWNDGDKFMNNDINHPIMGAVSSHVYTNNDRRCTNLAYGEQRYWSCIGRATVYSAIASVNWEWNPLMSESAWGHVGKFHTCAKGSCAGEGGWTDFVMTPLGGMAVRVGGDVARAKLWPLLDQHLSGNVPAKILKTLVKVVTDPAGVMNAAANLNFSGAFASRRPAGTTVSGASAARLASGRW